MDRLYCQKPAEGDPGPGPATDGHSSKATGLPGLSQKYHLPKLHCQLLYAGLKRCLGACCLNASDC